MKNVQYRWQNEESPSVPLRYCLTHTPHPLAPHSQNELELMYFFDVHGCRYQCAGHELTISAGDLVIVNPGEIHSCSRWGNPITALCLIVDPPALRLPDLSGWKFPSRIAGDDVIRAHFERLAAPTDDSDNPTHRLRIHECICGLLAHLLSYASPVPGSGNAERRAEIRSITAYIAEHLAEQISLPELAARMYLGPDRFYHVFREVMGISPSEYILSERIRTACRLLADTPMKITDIAQECGFCTSGYFAKKFSEQMNCTPLQYRKAIKNADFLTHP